MIRGCALDSGTQTTDTEIVRMSHCGSFYYDGRQVNVSSVLNTEKGNGQNGNLKKVHQMDIWFRIENTCKRGEPMQKSQIKSPDGSGYDIQQVFNVD